MSRSPCRERARSRCVGRSSRERLSLLPLLVPYSASRSARVTHVLMLLVIVAIAGGCSDTGGRQGVSGTAYLDGQPLDGAVIDFRAAAGHSGSSAGVGVVDGKFSIAAEDGLVPGEYEVSIQAFRETGRTVNDYQRGPVREKMLVQLKEAGALRSTIAADGDNSFRYDVTSVEGGQKL